MYPAMAWLSALRRYFAVVALGSLAWECIQLPLYTLWKTGSAAQITYAVAHCTGGDVLIAGATLIGSLLLFGVADWPRAHFVSVATVTLVAGIGTTAYSERINTARETWTYSNLMPLLPGTGIGLAPLAQWLVIPLLAFMVARPPRSSSCLDLPTVGITTSVSTPNHLARSHRRTS
jgi:hypothetical protein